MSTKQYSKFQKAASNTAVKIRAYGKFIHIIGAGLQIKLQSMDVDKGWTIGVALLNLFGAALPELAIIHEPVKSEEITPKESLEQEQP